MKKALIILLFLSGCASTMSQDCHTKVGPPPNQLLNAFGLIGAGVNQITDEKQEWDRKMDDCEAKYKATHPSS